MLSLEIEWLTGVCVATRSPADHAPEWPPQPDRIFSALVASFGAHGGRAEERAALEWLEAQEPPRLDAVDAFPRVAVTAFVPPNDVATLPEGRRRQPRRFPASVPLAEPGATHLRLVWAADAAAHLPALQALARDTSYVGHSSALVRCRFSVDDAAEGCAPARAAPYPGRLAELERLYRRHIEKGDSYARPRRELLTAPVETAPGAPSSLFGRRWIVLEAEEGERPDIRSAAIVARLLRAALMEKFATFIPPWLSGHMPDGAPTTDPHIAIVPLADIGWRHSDGGLKGLALVVPRALEDEWRAAATPAAHAEAGVLRCALAELRVGDTITLAEPRGEPRRIVWRLREAADPDLHSLKSDRYCATSTVWSTATPIALDRYPKAQGPARLAEAAEIIARACANIGLPAPASVEVHKHSAFRGAPSAWPPGGAPRWTGWARPKALADRPLFHATLRFDAPVRGPVILGAGRFFGLGLSLPLGARA
jgi:CRISPR-associated protein Csb2